MSSSEEEKLHQLCNKMNELLNIGKLQEANELLATCLDLLFMNQNYTKLLTSNLKKKLIQGIIDKNTKYGRIPIYMMLVHKDTLTLMCREIKKYNFDYSNEVYQLCKFSVYY